MSAQAQANYEPNGYIVPMGTEEHFAQQFDLSNTENARNSYQRFVPHYHTAWLAEADKFFQSDASTHQATI